MKLKMQLKSKCKSITVLHNIVIFGLEGECGSHAPLTALREGKVHISWKYSVINSTDFEQSSQKLQQFIFCRKKAHTTSSHLLGIHFYPELLPM